MCAARSEANESPTGLGELLEDPKRLRSDLALIERALRDNYPIEEKHRTALVAEALKIAITKSKDVDQKNGGYLFPPRERLRALAVIDRFDRTNLERARILAGIAEKSEPGYQPTPELHEHKHVHIEGPEAAPSTEVILVDDWYGKPDPALPAPNGKKRRNGKAAKKNGKAGRNGKAKRNGKKKKGGRNGKA